MMKKLFLYFSAAVLPAFSQLAWAQNAPGAAAPGNIPDIRDVKAPEGLPVNWLLILIVIGVLALLAAGLWYWKRKHSPRAPRPAPVVLPPPWAIAREKLKSLIAEDLPGKGRIKEYYSRLSGIVRQYMEDRFNLRAPEMTTEEFLFSLRSSSQLNTVQKEALKDFLTCCDMVKFAKYSSHAQEMVQSFVLAEKLIDETAQDKPETGGGS